MRPSLHAVWCDSTQYNKPYIICPPTHLVKDLEHGALHLVIAGAKAAAEARATNGIGLGVCVCVCVCVCAWVSEGLGFRVRVSEGLGFRVRVSEGFRV